MRKINLLLASFLFVFAVHAQNVPDVSSIKLDTKSDYNAQANDAALKVSVYLLTTPVEKNNAARLSAETYLIKWMRGTPRFSFTLDEDAAELANRNYDLFMVFMADMAKYVLENPSDATNMQKIKLNGVKTLIEYSRNPKNNVNLDGELMRTI